MIVHYQIMSSKRRQQRWGMPGDQREPLGARIALILILLNIFLWIGLRNVDILVVSLGSLLLALAGLVIGYRAGKRIQRHGGRISGESMTRIANWGNLLLFVGSFFLFCYLLLLGMLRGDLL